MQTFFPFPDPVQSAEVLGNDELVQQIADIVVILNTLNETEDTGFADHPVVKMWRGHEVYLAHYGLILCDELTTNRPVILAFVVTTPEEVQTSREKIEQHLDWSASGDFDMNPPFWIRDPNLTKAHRSELLRINPRLYRNYFPTTPMDIPTYWPVK